MPLSGLIVPDQRSEPFSTFGTIYTEVAIFLVELVTVAGGDIHTPIIDRWVTPM